MVQFRGMYLSGGCVPTVTAKSDNKVTRPAWLKRRRKLIRNSSLHHHSLTHCLCRSLLTVIARHSICLLPSLLRLLQKAPDGKRTRADLLPCHASKKHRSRYSSGPARNRVSQSGEPSRDPRPFDLIQDVSSLSQEVCLSRPDPIRYTTAHSSVGTIFDLVAELFGTCYVGELHNVAEESLWQPARGTSLSHHSAQAPGSVLPPVTPTSHWRFCSQYPHELRHPAGLGTRDAGRISNSQVETRR